MLLGYRLNDPQFNHFYWIIALYETAGKVLATSNAVDYFLTFYMHFWKHIKMMGANYHGNPEGGGHFDFQNKAWVTKYTSDADSWSRRYFVPDIKPSKCLQNDM